MAFRGKVAVITGGGSGMGQLAVKRLARSGAKVAALDVNEEGLKETAAMSDNITTFVVDVTDADAMAKVMGEVEEKIGPVDRVMAAAAIMPTGLLSEMDGALTKKIMDINYGGVVNTVNAVLPSMLERGTGDIIIFSSLMGFMNVMYLGAYCASKAATAAFAEVLYHENRDSGLRFALVAPPSVQTPLLDQISSPLKVMDQGAKPIKPEEVLDAIEKTLENGKFLAAPGQAKGAIIANRLIPGAIWKNMHKLEGR